MSSLDDLLTWLRDVCGRYELEPVAVYRKQGRHDWPLQAADADELERKLDQGGHFLPLPKEPAALANIIEVSLLDYLFKQVEGRNDIVLTRGTERGYPDLELSGPAFGDGFYAVDVKAARRAKNGYQTQSRITLYTGNTYFRWPELQWPGTFRPFQDYEAHLDIIAIYTLDESLNSRIRDFELIVQETWRIASKQRSSTTREYLGAVMNIEDIKAGNGDFETKVEFYKFWRAFPFKTGVATEKQLRKLLNKQKR